MTSTNEQEYLEAHHYVTILTELVGQTVHVKDFSIKKLVANGSYCSDIYKAKLSYTKIRYGTPEVWTEVHFFVKDLFENLSTISKEHFMYTKVLPEFEEILKSANITQQLTPRVYEAVKSKREVHIFEDLTKRDYDVCDRLLGYDFDQAKAVLRKLAIYHAASFVYSKSNQDVVENVTGFYYETPFLMDFVDAKILENAEYVAPIVATWPGYEDISKKLLTNTGETFRRKFLQALDKNQGELRIPLHGDVWIRNIMMHKDEKTNEWDAIFLDLQNAFVGSPVLDVLNMFLTSIQLDVLKFKSDELIAFYHEILESTLKSLNYSPELIPTLELLKREFRRVEYYNYYLLLFPFAQTNLSEELADGASFDDFTNEDGQQRNRKDIFSNPRVLATYKFMLKRFDNLGILD